MLFRMKICFHKMILCNNCWILKSRISRFCWCNNYGIEFFIILLRINYAFSFFSNIYATIVEFSKAESWAFVDAIIMAYHFFCFWFGSTWIDLASSFKITRKSFPAYKRMLFQQLLPFHQTRTEKSFLFNLMGVWTFGYICILQIVRVQPRVSDNLAPSRKCTNRRQSICHWLNQCLWLH